MTPVASILLYSALLYAVLALVGGWVWVLLRRLAPTVWRPPAPLIGIVLLQFVGWTWSAHLDRGLDELWPYLTGVTILFTLAIAWRERKSLLAVLRNHSAWTTEAAVTASSVVLTLITYRHLLGRGTLSVEASNNDIASYANVVGLISHDGLSAPGSIFGFHLGHLARIDVYGEFNFLSFARWLCQREVFEVAVPVLTVVCAIACQIMAGILRRSTNLRPAVVALVAVLPQSTWLFSYIVMCYYGSQLLGLVMCLAATLIIVCGFPTHRRAEFVVNVVSLSILAIGLTYTYAHMLLLFLPIVVIATLLRRGTTLPMARNLVGGLASVALMVLVIAPDRFSYTIHRFIDVGAAQAGFPQPGVLPIALVGFQGAWEGTVTVATIAGSTLLVVMACLAARSTVREQGASWRLPVVGIIVIGLLSYGVMYFTRGGPVYEQWKWISFLQPLLCISLIAPLLAVAFRRWGSATTVPVIVGLTGLLVFNVVASEDFRSEVDRSGNWVSPVLGHLGRDPAFADLEELNVDLHDYWETMWAAAALAPRTTYLVSPTYYGQQPPMASWTLMRRAKVPPGTRSGDVRPVGVDYALVRRPTTTNSL